MRLSSIVPLYAKAGFFMQNLAIRLAQTYKDIHLCWNILRLHAVKKLRLINSLSTLSLAAILLISKSAVAGSTWIFAQGVISSGQISRLI
jgi:hypothetical protein